MGDVAKAKSGEPIRQGATTVHKPGLPVNYNDRSKQTQLSDADRNAQRFDDNLYYPN